MGVIGVDFTDVPDKILPIQRGTYPFEILSADVEPVNNPAPGEQGHDPKKVGKNKVVVELRHAQEGHSDFGRKLTDYISTEMKTKLKNLYHSATGNRPGSNGFDTADIVGKTCMVEIATETGKNQQTGKTYERSVVQNYLIPQS